MDTRDRAHTDDQVTAGKVASEGLGGAAAGAAGAAFGTFAGPIGTLIGGLAGIVGGWWAGKSAAEAANHYSIDDDRYYRHNYESSSTRLADRSYERVRPAYQLGHVAGLNPDYRDREWESVEPEVRKGWTSDLREKNGEWSSVSSHARDAYARSRAAAAGSTIAEAIEHPPTSS